MQEWDENFEGADVLKSVLAESSSKEPLGQGRCTGFGGGIKAIKIKKSGCQGEDCEQKHADKAAHKLERKANDFDSLKSASKVAYLSNFLAMTVLVGHGACSCVLICCL